MTKGGRTSKLQHGVSPQHQGPPSLQGSAPRVQGLCLPADAFRSTAPSELLLCAPSDWVFASPSPPALFPSQYHQAPSLINHLSQKSLPCSHSLQPPPEASPPASAYLYSHNTFLTGLPDLTLTLLPHNRCKSDHITPATNPPMAFSGTWKTAPSPFESLQKPP